MLPPFANPEQYLENIATEWIKNGFLHVINIDVQERFLNDLRGDRPKKFPKEIVGFSQKAEALGLSSTWVYYRTRQEVACCCCKAGRSDCSYLTIPSDAYVKPPIRKETYIKCSNSTFGTGRWYSPTIWAEVGFEAGLRQKRAQTLIVTGMNTSACVLDTCLDGMRAGFNVLLLKNLLADTSIIVNDNDPDDHKAYIFNNIRCGFLDNFLCLSSDKLIDLIEANKPKNYCAKNANWQSFPKNIL